MCEAKKQECSFQLRNALKIGWIGCGIMGLPMCCNLIRFGGHKLFVHSRSPVKCSEAVKMGATLCASAKEIVLHHVDVVISLVGFPEETKEVVYGSQGFIEGVKSLPDHLQRPIFIDMSTNDPQVTFDIAKSLNKLNCFALDAPVSGGDIGARLRRLSIFIGGDEHTYQILRPKLFEALSDVNAGGCITYIGQSGEGHRAKIMNQILISSNMIGVCEALLYAQTAGIPLEKALPTVCCGAAGSWSLSNLGPKIIQEDFAPGFIVDHFVKDLGIALKDSAALKLKLPGLQLAYSLYAELQKKGFGNMGTQILIKELQDRQ